MANGRFISRSIAHDLELNSLSMEAHLLYLHAIPHLDRDGCITAEPNSLWAMVCPLLDLRNEMPTLVQELCRSGLAQLTDDGGLWFKGFAKNQVLPPTKYNREAPSKYHVQNKGSTTPAHVQNNSSYKLSEVKLSKDKDEEQAASPPSSSLRAQVVERLQGEWATVGLTQIDSHTELAERYGIEAWRDGFDATKRSARSSMAYVEKVIISTREKVNGTPPSEKRQNKDGYYDFHSKGEADKWFSDLTESQQSEVAGAVTVKGTLVRPRILQT